MVKVVKSLEGKFKIRDDDKNILLSYSSHPDRNSWVTLRLDEPEKDLLMLLNLITQKLVEISNE